MRQNEWMLKESEKICILDCDGVLNTYPACWVEFVNKILKTNFTDLNMMKQTLPYQTYKNCKERYRTSGYKETLKPDKNATEFTKRLKEMGYTIIVITARPMSEYPMLFKQTMRWLDKNNILFDALFASDKRKYAKIITEFPHIRFAVDDSSFECNLLSKWGYKSFIKNNEYNAKTEIETNVTRIYSLFDVFEYIKT
jgi:uncharacterized HAD superfamily protein